MEGITGFERRHIERLALKAIATVQVASSGAGRVFELSTQDISSGGAFFPMEVPLPTGEKVKITLHLSISRPERTIAFAGKARITTKGHVVRSTAEGMAVAFEGPYKITSEVM